MGSFIRGSEDRSQIGWVGGEGVEAGYIHFFLRSFVMRTREIGVDGVSVSCGVAEDLFQVDGSESMFA